MINVLVDTFIRADTRYLDAVDEMIWGGGNLKNKLAKVIALSVAIARRRENGYERKAGARVGS